MNYIIKILKILILYFMLSLFSNLVISLEDCVNVNPENPLFAVSSNMVVKYNRSISIPFLVLKNDKCTVLITECNGEMIFSRKLNLLCSYDSCRDTEYTQPENNCCFDKYSYESKTVRVLIDKEIYPILNEYNKCITYLDDNFNLNHDKNELYFNFTLLINGYVKTNTSNHVPINISQTDECNIKNIVKKPTNIETSDDWCDIYGLEDNGAFKNKLISYICIFLLIIIFLILLILFIKKNRAKKL
jgi:hypothetical protein